MEKLVNAELDFDMIGMSYYPFWDGGMDNMSRVLELIQERYGKKAFLAETPYCYTTEDAAVYYGGCSWDNQAFFDFEGHPLESINVFNYMRNGAK